MGTAYPRIFLAAGEHSGDRLGADLAQAIRRRAPDARFCGIGGPRMAAAGVHLVADTTTHAGMGLFYAMKHLGDWARVYRRCAAFFNHEPPDVLTPIDNPGFNLGKAGFDGLCGLARTHGVPVCYYVSPQVWAWWPGRIRRIGRLVDRMMAVLPFEKALYDGRGIDCRYVGHPLVETVAGQPVDDEFLRGLERSGAPVIGLLPGSRAQEIRHTFPIIAAAARAIAAEFPRAAFHVAAAAAAHVKALRAILDRAGLAAQVHVGRTPDILCGARLCLVVSGTATLETALHRTPMVIVYRTSAWHRWVTPWFLSVKHIGLVNIIGGDTDIVPEFLKFDDDPAPVAAAALSLLRDDSAWQACRSRIDSVVAALGGGGAADRAAEAVLDLVGRA